jgi:two-component system, NtrC family, response regulator AtoC
MRSNDPTRPDLLDETSYALTRLLVLSERGSASYFLRPKTSVTLGRHGDCELVIDLPSVSRHHARLYGGDPPHIEDLGGMNGVRVRGQRIMKGSKVPIRAGDVVELGGAIVVIHASRSAQGPAAGAMARADPYRVDADDPLRAVEQLIDLVAQSDLAVLLLGETGVGKTVAAEAIHARSARARGPLLRLNCASLPEAMLEAELFGSDRAKPGILEAASTGTILFDEIGEMPLATQAKLLDVIETREVKRRGSSKSTRIDVRFLGATNRDLLAHATEGRFRLDLYYRLNGISLVIPPLRERTREIPSFATRFLEEAAAKTPQRRAPRLSSEALGVLIRHPFFGNIRELKSTMERAFSLTTGGVVGPEHLVFEAPPPHLAAQWSAHRNASATYPPAPMSSATPMEVAVPLIPPSSKVPSTVPASNLSHPPPEPAPVVAPLREQMDAFERDRIVAALEKCKGNQTRAAELLGMSRRVLIARIEHYKLPRPRKR